MDKNPKPCYTNVRPLILTSLLAIFSILAAMDIAYLTHVVGYFVLMIMLGMLAVIFMTCDRSIFVLNTMALVIILYFVSGKALNIALLGFVLILGALLLATAVSKKSTKTSAVLTVSITVSLGYILVAALLYAADGNSLAVSDLFDKLNGIFDSIKASMADVIRAYIDSLPEEMLAYYAKLEITKEILLESTLVTMESFLDLVQLLLPGIFIFLAQTMAYIGVSSFEKTARLVRCDVILPEARWRLFPTQITCIIYIVVTSAYLLSGFFSSASTFLILVMNFWIALMPVMIACGCNGLIMRLKHPRLRKSMIFILILFAAACLFMTDIALSFGIFMLTFMGAQDVSLARTAEAMERKHRNSDER